MTTNLDSAIRSGNCFRQESPPGSNSALSSAEWQQQVDAHFQASAPYWKDLYERNGVFEAIHQQRRDLVLSLVERLGMAPHSAVLEIGCGAGATTIPLAQRGYIVHAVDTVDDMLQLTREAARRAGVSGHVRTLADDAHSLALPDNSFSLVVAMGVTPYLHSLPKALREMARVLQPGGHLVINADNRWRLNHVLDPRRFPALAGVRLTLRGWLERAGLPKLSGPRPQMYSLGELDRCLAAAGLKKLEGRTLGFGPFSLFNHNLFSESFGVKLHRKLQRLSDHGFPLLRSTGAQYVVLATKPGLDIKGHAA